MWETSGQTPIFTIFTPVGAGKRQTVINKRMYYLFSLFSLRWGHGSIHRRTTVLSIFTIFTQVGAWKHLPKNYGIKYFHYFHLNRRGGCEWHLVRLLFSLFSLMVNLRSENKQISDNFDHGNNKVPPIIVMPLIFSEVGGWGGYRFGMFWICKGFYRI